MKSSRVKRAAILLTLSLMVTSLLSGCVKVPADGLSRELVCFPGTEWNMTPEQVKKALSLSGDQYTVLMEDTNGDFVFCVRDWDVLGKEATVAFRFSDYTEGEHLGLAYVYVLFTGETDHAIIQNAVSAEIGEPDKYADNLCSWNSTETLASYLDNAVPELKELKPEKYDMLKEDPAAWLSLYNATGDTDEFCFLLDSLEDRENVPALIFWGHRITQLLQYAQYGYPQPETTEAGG